jgi:hypothetical protein
VLAADVGLPGPGRWLEVVDGIAATGEFLRAKPARRFIIEVTVNL